MESSGKKSALEYGKPPWVFKGSALYQLHLVKAETARAFIPKEFKLVEAFGYTLGGFFLANYEDSPAGTFDELVIIAGIVWNPPTSCAWAARVLVNSDKACVHGRKDVGLPSQVANFTKNQSVTVQPKQSQFGSFLRKIGMSRSTDDVRNFMDIQVKETNNHTEMEICSINLNANAMEAPQNDVKKWTDLAFKISLPSFSGRTEYNPHLLKYSCKIECRLRVVPPAKVMAPSDAEINGEINSEHGGFDTAVATRNPRDDERNRSISIMLSKPILAMKFNCLKMDVEAPSVVSL